MTKHITDLAIDLAIELLKLEQLEIEYLTMNGFDQDKQDGLCIRLLEFVNSMTLINIEKYNS